MSIGIEDASNCGAKFLGKYRKGPEGEEMTHRVIRLAIVVAVLIGGVAIGAGQASAVLINNPGFEDPVASAVCCISAITGWTISGSGAGVWNINDFPLGFWTVPAPQGKQIAFVSPAPAPGSPATISQDLGIGVLLADTVYTLSGMVGHPSDPVNFPPADRFLATYTVTVLAGVNVLGSATGTGPLGTFAPFQVSFNTGSLVGTELVQLQLSSSGAQTGFDNISLAVPEPSTLLLLGFGLVGLGGAAWRHRRP